MAVTQDVWDKIIGAGGLVETHWPDVEITMTGDQADRFNWRELLEKLEQDGEGLGLKTPFVVMQVGPQTDPPDGLPVTAMTTMHPISLHYIRSNHLTEDEQSGGRTIAEIIAAHLEILKPILRAGNLSAFQVFGLPHVDVGDNNPANLVFLEGSHPLQAGTLTFSAVVW